MRGKKQLNQIQGTDKRFKIIKDEMGLDSNGQAPKQTNKIAQDMIIFKASESTEKYRTAKLSYIHRTSSG